MAPRAKNVADELEQAEDAWTDCPIREFKMLDHYIDSKGIFTCPMVAILGRRRSGKSVKLISMLEQVKHTFGTAYLFSPTAFGTGVFGTIFNNAFCYGEAKAEHLKMIQAVQDYLKQTHKEGGLPFLTIKDLTCLVVLDDCGSLPIMKSAFMQELASNCRNSNMSLWFSVQGFNQVPPVVRDNLDVFITNLTSNQKVLKKMYEEIFGCFPTFGVFMEAFRFCASDYGSLVWRNAGAHDDVDHSIFFYRAIEQDANSFTLDLPMQKMIFDLLGKNAAELAEDKLKELDRLEQVMSKMNGEEAGEDDEMVYDPDDDDAEGGKQSRPAPQSKRKPGARSVTPSRAAVGGSETEGEGEGEDDGMPSLKPKRKVSRKSSAGVKSKAGNFRFQMAVNQKE